MKIWLGLLVLFTAAAISCVAAYFSVVGLVALFAASAIPVMIMGGTLEFAKLVGSGWLKLNWSNPNTNRFHRFCLTGFVVSLMFITAIGIYGFLMAAHLEQTAPRADIGVQVQQLQLQVDQRNQENQRIQQRMNQIDQNIAVFLQNSQAARGMRASQSMKTERDKLNQQYEANNQSINSLQKQLAPLRMQNNEVEAKLGPVKYFAKLLGLPEDSAVQLVICLIMLSFDTLAVALLVAGLQTLREAFEERKESRRPAPTQIIDEMPEERRERLKNRAVEILHEILPETEKTEQDSETFVDDESLQRIREIDEALRELEAELDDHVEPTVEEEVETDPADILRLAGLRPDMERAVIAHEIPIMDEHVEDDMDQEMLDPRDVDRDTLISILERHPDLINEIEQIVEDDVVEELSDREKLLDLLEKNPAIIADMASIIASQITKDDKPLGDSWLKD